jgi:hypothetical protein
MELQFAVDVAASATFAGLLVGLFKLGVPAARSWLLVVVAIAAGIASAFLLFVGQGGELTAQAIAQTVLVGITAAGTAAGVTRTDEAGENKRNEVKQESSDDHPMGS